MEVLSDIPVRLDPEAVLKQLRLRRENKYIEKEVQEVLGLVLPVAKPKAVYKVAYVDNRNGDSLDIDGVRFTSRVLRVNLDQIERVFPYVATCGQELEAITVPADDIMKAYCLDTVKRLVLGSAISYLKDYLTGNYALGQISNMNPGSLEDWPITQQKELFSILDNVREAIGVELTERCLMRPLKSVSGIHFPTEIRFESCQLCPREGCIGRRAPYDPALVKKYRQEIKP